MAKPIAVIIISSLIVFSSCVVSANAAPPLHVPIDSLTGKSAYDGRPLQLPKPQPKPDPNAKSAAFLRAQKECGFPKSRTYLTKYRDLTGVVLQVYVPDRYIEAQKCIGREEACIDESRVGEGKRKEALDDLLMRGIAYRAPIHLGNLVKIFGDMLRQQLMPYVLPDQNCKAADLVVKTDGRNIERYERTPDILIVKVNLTIVDDTKPPIAVLTMGTYRLDPSQRNVWESVTGRSTGIPLDLTDEQITARIEYFAKSFGVHDEKGIAE